MENNSFGARLKRAWNAFANRDPTRFYPDYSASYFHRPDRVRFSRGNERSIVTSVYNKIAIDVSSMDIKHCKLDNNDRFTEVMDTKLNKCLTLEANIDQTGRAFIQDVVMSMLDEGCVAIVPVDTKGDPVLSDSYDILSMRTGKILEWYPSQIKVEVYNDKIGKKQDIILPKKMVAIIENPLYAVINEPNSTMQRLIRKLNLLDIIDEQSGAGKLDLVVQLPYTVKSDIQKERAEKRRKSIEDQLTNSKYGIAYADATEKITQLNRPVENNLMKQIEYLTNMLYSQLGMSQSILDGTADEQTMLNYYSRTTEPIITAIVEEMRRKFLSQTARSQKQSIMYFRDPFKLVSISKLSEIGSTLTSSEIASSNEIRQVIGWKPSDDPRADQLVNSNINKINETQPQDDQLGEINNDPELMEEESDE